ncbi:MAG: hypothetical protein ACPGRW_06185 [Flavobacteriaceae bacterium]
MSKYNQLSEKDVLLKDLREKQSKANNIKVKQAIEVKVNALENNKTIEK